MGDEDLRKAADGRHPQRDSGLQRPVVVHGTRQRSGTDAHRPPQRQAVVHAQTQIGMKTGQDRGHLRRDVVDRDGAATLAVGQRDAEEHLACRQIRTEGGGPDTAAQYAGIFTFDVESGERAPAPEAPPRCVLLFSGRDIEGIPGRHHANRGARTPPARRRVVRSPLHRPAVPRAPHPLVECIHDLSRRRTAEVPDPVRRHSIHRLEGAVLVVPDGPGTLTVGQRRIARIAQPDREDLVPFLLVVGEHRHRDRLPRLAGREGQPPTGGRVVRACRRRPVRCPKVHGHRCTALSAEAHGERRAPSILGHRHVVDDQRRQPGGGRGPIGAIVGVIIVSVIVPDRPRPLRVDRRRVAYVAQRHRERLGPLPPRCHPAPAPRSPSGSRPAGRPASHPWPRSPHQQSPSSPTSDTRRSPHRAPRVLGDRHVVDGQLRKTGWKPRRRSPRLRDAQRRVARAAQRHCEDLVPFHLVVIKHLDRDRLPRLAGLERRHSWS